MGSALDHWKAKGLDYSKILYKPDIGPEVGTYCQMKQDHLLDKSLDQRLILDAAKPAIEEGKSVIIDTPVVNTDRVVGTITGAEVSLEILNSGILEEYNFDEIGIAGHPEGSPDISQETIDNFLNDKFALTKSKGLNLELVTQFFFDAKPFIDWCDSLIEKKITIPVRVGFPGPASFKTLLNFGLMSGVGNSINFLKKNSSKVTDLLTKTSNDEMLISLAEYAYMKNPLKSFHCFPFGGFEKTCLWLNEIQNGDFIVENQRLMLHKKIF